MTIDLSALDIQLAVVEADAFLRQAAAHATDESDRLAFYLDARMVHHPELLATNDSYPGFAEWVAAREASNRNAKEAL
ncbi:hypothetical protein [Streptomyces sp. NPDC001492]